LASFVILDLNFIDPSTLFRSFLLSTKLNIQAGIFGITTQLKQGYFNHCCLDNQISFLVKIILILLQTFVTSVNLAPQTKKKIQIKKIK